MKNLTGKFAKYLAVILSAMMILGAVAVSADDTALDVITTDYEGSDEDILILPAPDAEVFLALEGSEETEFLGSVSVAIDGSATAGSVIAELLADYGLEGLEYGYISSVDGLAGGTFGGWDGWMYAVKYYVLNENDEITLYLDIPSVGVNDYPILSSCEIVLYYADYGAPFAGSTHDENGMIKLVTYSPVYDENYNVVSFDEAPLANGEFTFTEYTIDENGETVLGETYVFTSDENGMTKLHQDLRELPNGDYIGSVGKQSDKTAVVGDETITLPETVLATDVYTVDVHPTEEEILKEKLMMLMIGAFMA